MTKGAVSQWMTRAAKEGEEALRARPHLGAAPKLRPEQLGMLPEFLSHGAEAYGFRGELWTCARVAEIIRREFAVRYHKDQVSRLLKALRWTPQKPAERAAQRDEARIAEWREQTWPELKKSPGGRAGKRQRAMARERGQDAATVLLVEDYDDTRVMMRMLLQAKGCRVVEAADGQAAVELAEEHCSDLDLILMDLNLPVLSGYEATRRILARDATCHVPVVAFSAQCSGDRKRRALDAGCVECLPKPADFMQLDEMLARYTH